MKIEFTDDETKVLIEALRSRRSYLDVYRGNAGRPGTYESRAPDFYGNQIEHVDSALAKLTSS